MPSRVVEEGRNQLWFAECSHVEDASSIQVWGNVQAYAARNPRYVHKL